MNKINLIVNRIAIDKLNFQLSDNSQSKDEGRADVNVNFSEKMDDEKLQPINVELNLNYEDSSYKVETRVFGYFSLNTEDFSRFVKDIDNFEGDFQSALLNPILNKLRLFLGFLSEGNDGVVKIPDLTINYSKGVPKSLTNKD